MKKYGFIRCGACVVKSSISNVPYNVEEIKKCIDEAEKNDCDITVFPELTLTSYTLADLFHHSFVIDSSLQGLIDIKNYTKDKNGVFIIGIPIRANNQLFNCAAVIEQGHILGIVPKTYIPNYGEFYEERWFSKADQLIAKEIVIDKETIPFKTNMIFQDKNLPSASFGIEICEDLWCVYPPSNDLCTAGAKIIFNLSASNELIGKCEYRKNLVKSNSEKNICGYVYTSAGINESTTDLVFSGASMIYENGKLLGQNKRFDFESNLIFNDIDVKRLENMRTKDISYMGVIKNRDFDTIYYNGYEHDYELVRKYAEYPFVPKNEEVRNKRCEEIINIQAYALAKRLKSTHIDKCVIGISGGLDSTLAFLVVNRTFDILNIDKKNIIGITMPGFGTTKKTKSNSDKIVEAYGATLKVMDIKEACLEHFRTIEHDAHIFDVTYENVQARERTQILMDYANKVGGLVIGTGDLSELALGWCTYNGDHMSNYAVNVSIPKTLVRYLIESFMLNETDKDKKEVLKSILDTPVSPELLPPSKTGEIVQITENTIGPYYLHDFFLYHFLRYNADIAKIYYLATKTFTTVDKEEIKKWLLVFIKRFFSQQFKRSCIPDGPKVGTISLSPRGDLRMPSDADVESWVKELKKL